MSGTRIARWGGVLCLVLALGVGAFLIAAQQSALDPVTPPPANSFAPDLVKHGAELAALGGADSQAAVTRTTDNDQGASIYVSACAGCHEGPRAMPFGGINLALSSGIAGPNPTNLFNVVLYGLPAADAAHAPIMPGFAAAISDAQLIALARYLRAHFTDKEPWRDMENSLREARSAARAATARSAPGDGLSPPGTVPGGQNEAQR
jgi:mono/diheme cytochrome c family protein